MASTRQRFAVEATGVRRVQQQLRDLGLGDALAEHLRPVHRDVSEIVAAEARTLVPHRSGKLGASIQAVDDPKDRWPLVRAGVKGDVPYGGPIHFGWPNRHLYRSPSELVGRTRVLLESGGGGSGFGLRSLGKIERRRARVAKRKTPRGKRLPQGGPIAPQPFLYDAADGRRQAVIDVYQDGVNTIFNAAIAAGGGA